MIFLQYHILDVLLILSLLAYFMPAKKTGEVQLIWGAIIGAAVSLASKYVVPLFRKRTYTSGSYALGEIYRRNVLGENISTRDDRVVGNTAVYLAKQIFTAGFGICIGSNDHLDLVWANNWAGYRDKFAKAHPGYKVTQSQFERAAILAKLYFQNQKAPPPTVWDLANFERLPYLGPIPDPENPEKLYTTELPGGVFIKDGYFVNPSAAEATAIRIAEGSLTVEQAKQMGVNSLTTGQPITTTTTSTPAAGSSKTYLYLAAAGVAAYFLMKKKRA